MLFIVYNVMINILQYINSGEVLAGDEEIGNNSVMTQGSFSCIADLLVDTCSIEFYHSYFL